MEDATGRKPAISRRRLTFWALFGTVGLIMGAAYATGFASTTNTAADTNHGDATPLLGVAAPNSAAQYAGTITAPNPLAVAFDGYYGTIAAPTDMFEVDLTGNDPQGQALTGTFYVDLVLNNWHALGLDATGTGQWDIVELGWQEHQCDAGFANNWTGATAQQMHVERVDAHVTFAALAAGHKYCFGLDTATSTTEAAVLAAASGGNVTGTVLFRSSLASSPTAPQFTATVNRSA